MPMMYTCPECHRSVSSLKGDCPHCGEPVSVENPKIPTGRDFFVLSSVSTGMLFIFVGIFFLFLFISRPPL